MKPILNLASVGLLLVVPACDALAPKPVGSVAGRVIIDGEGAGGVTVSLSSGATTATGPDGGYRFADVEGGTYSVSISGYPSDATFSTGSVSVEIVSDGQTVIADFRGQYIRTANLTGRVAVDGQSVAGITVTLAGMAEDLTATNGVGQFAFSNLRAGAYTVAISDYGDAEFLATTQTVMVGVGQTRVLSFEGTYPRTASVSGRVAVENEALEGVVVTLDGFGEQLIRETDAGGRYSFTMLRAGNYTIEISTFDSTDVAFSNTSGTVSVGVGEPRVWDFEGTYVRESTIMGRVTVDGTGLEGVTVRLQGMGADESRVTDENGQFIFSNLRAGEYQLAISGFDAREYGFSTTSATVRLEHGRTADVPFEGIMLRTAAIMGPGQRGGRGPRGRDGHPEWRGREPDHDDRPERSLHVQRTAGRQLPGRDLGVRYGRLLVRDHFEERRARAWRDGDGSLRGHSAAHLRHRRAGERRRDRHRGRDGHAFRRGRAHGNDRRDRPVRHLRAWPGATTRSRSQAMTRTPTGSRSLRSM